MSLILPLDACRRAARAAQMYIPCCCLETTDQQENDTLCQGRRLLCRLWLSSACASTVHVADYSKYRTTGNLYQQKLLRRVHSSDRDRQPASVWWFR